MNSREDEAGNEDRAAHLRELAALPFGAALTNLSNGVLDSAISVDTEERDD